jgi:hypothetical protein
VYLVKVPAPSPPPSHRPPLLIPDPVSSRSILRILILLRVGWAMEAPAGPSPGRAPPLLTPAASSALHCAATPPLRHLAFLLLHCTDFALGAYFAALRLRSLCVEARLIGDIIGIASGSASDCHNCVTSY